MTESTDRTPCTLAPGGRFVFCPGSVGGRLVPLPAAGACGPDRSVSARRGVLIRAGADWELRAGARGAVRLRPQPEAGSWTLRDAGLSGVVVVGPAAKAPALWIVLESEAVPGPLLAIADAEEVIVGVTKERRLRRYRRPRVDAIRLAWRDGAYRVVSADGFACGPALRSGDVLDARPGVPRIRVRAVSAGGAPGGGRGVRPRRRWCGPLLWAGGLLAACLLLRGAGGADTSPPSWARRLQSECEALRREVHRTEIDPVIVVVPLPPGVHEGPGVHEDTTRKR